MQGDPGVMRCIGEGRTVTRNDTWRSVAGMLAHGQPRGYGMGALEECASHMLVGRAGYVDPPGWPGFELGWLPGRAYSGLGFATEAATRCLRHAFEELKRDVVISLVRPANAPSIRVAERLGMSNTGEIELPGSKAMRYEAKR